jgi:hypothetical protein
MKINLSDPNPGAWFDYPDDPDGFRVKVRVCSGKDLEEIQDKTTKVEVEYKAPKKRAQLQRIEYVVVDEKKQRELLWDFCIVDWKNLYDETGSVIPCTKENKLKLMRESIGFASFIADCLEKLTEEGAKREEEAEKNSLMS